MRNKYGCLKTQKTKLVQAQHVETVNKHMGLQKTTLRQCGNLLMEGKCALRFCVVMY